jgi:outer membrane protein assembly factor BamA
MARATVSAAEEFENIFDGDQPRTRPTFALGYSLYRIGSWPVFADVAVFALQAESRSRFPNETARYGDQFGTQVVVGVPLRGSQSVRAEWNAFRTPITLESSDGTERATSRYDNVQLFWLRDTTDDPLYPLHGSLLKAGVVGGRGHSVGISFFPEQTLSRQAYDYYGGEVSGSRYWSLSNERALSAHGRYTNTRTYFQVPFESDYDNSQISIGAGFTKRLSGPNTDAWIDFRVDGTRYGTSSFNDLLNARIELAHRSKWGVARLGFSYNGQRN